MILRGGPENPLVMRDLGEHSTYGVLTLIPSRYQFVTSDFHGELRTQVNVFFEPDLRRVHHNAEGPPCQHRKNDDEYAEKFGKLSHVSRSTAHGVFSQPLLR